ncbi:uncharacterized protein LOC100410798 isoform X7 [Callithrix jacchus]|uniref:neuroblastoma breakpoint family member 1 isoform X5 n=1 Tax=Callithrix jacchus TaxID=9483 RepID=UPI0023DD4B6F|nr:neuroblastoma breakpoint family member 1 isoform X5 [Callithrix jacchus]
MEMVEQDKATRRTTNHPHHHLDLTVFVPGCAFGTPNVTMAAPGRACSRQTTEVNFPDIVENSYTQQEETKPSFRDSKNRLLLSQVAYFQNYQLKTDKDRKDDDEEQKYRDSKNKHFLSQVAYYLGCRLKTEVSGFLCCAPKVNMVTSGRRPSRKIPEENITEGIEKSCSQQEENKPNFGASKNRLLLSQVAYFQNYRLKSYKAREDDDEERRYGDCKNKLFMSQPAYCLGSQLKMEVPGFLCSAPNINMVASGRPSSRIHPEVNVPEGIEKSCSQQEENKPKSGACKNRLLLSQVAYFQNYRLKSYKDRKDHDEEQKYRDSKNKLLMSQVAYYLGCRLKMEVPGFLFSASNISKVASGRPPYRNYTEVNVPEGIAKSCSQQEDKLNVRVRKNRCLMSEVNYSLNCRLRTYKDQKYDEEQKYRDSKNKHLMSQAAYYLDCRLKTEESQGDVEEEEEKGPMPPRDLQESVEEEAPQESWDEGDSTLSVPPGPSAFNETFRSNFHSLEEQQVNLAVDIDKIKNDQEEEEDQGPPCPRLIMELVEAEEPEVFRYSLDLLYSTYTAYPEFYFTFQAYTYVIFLFVEEHVRLTLDMGSRFVTMTVTRLPLVSWVGVIFPH